MSNMYILEDGKPKLVADAVEWGHWFEANNHKRIVARTYYSAILDKEHFISTVFLALDHGWPHDGDDPVLWETLDFPEHDVMRRYTSKEDAIKGHWDVVKLFPLKVYRLKITTFNRAVYNRNVTAISIGEAIQVIKSEAWPFGVEFIEVEEEVKYGWKMTKVVYQNEC